jgi:hypothetical protein
MLIGAFYAPTLTVGDLRIVRAYEAIEDALGVTFEHSRDAREFAGRATSEGRIIEAVANTEGLFVRVLELPWRPAESPPMLYALLEFSEDPRFVARAERVGEELSEALCAFWSVISPEATAADIASQIKKSDAGPPPFGLPALRRQYELAPQTPQRLGWINYWATGTAERIAWAGDIATATPGFHARPTKNGWLVRLTKDPLSLDREDHLELLFAMYNKFPAIGGREPPN